MTVHRLKTWSQSFNEIKSGLKTFEIRYNDRDYKTGDTLILLEYFPGDDIYSYKAISVIVKSVLYEFPSLQKGYCIMSIELKSKKVPSVKYEKMWKTLKAESGNRVLIGSTHLQESILLKERMNFLENEVFKENDNKTGESVV